MVKVSKVVNWLSKALFQPQELGNPISLVIVGYEEEQSAKGINRRLSGKHANGKIYQFDVFGEIVNKLISELGEDSDMWINKRIQVMLVMKGDKEIKQITVIP